MNKLKTTILSLCLILMCVSIVSSASAVDNDNGTFCNVTNSYSIDDNSEITSFNVNFDRNVTSDGTPSHPDKNRCFEIVLDNPMYDACMYQEYWEFDEADSFGVELINSYCDSFTHYSCKHHFVFHILDDVDGHFVKLNLVKTPWHQISNTVSYNILN